MKQFTRFSAHTFNSLTSTTFSSTKYSQLKHGSNSVAEEFGTTLARSLFEHHSDMLLANKCVVIPSPYNFVKNAATIMTEHFVNELNVLLTQHSGEQVEYSTIHRKVSYINDYGFLSKEKRKGLIDNDSFYLVKKFYKNKLLIFIDDVLITGTHEDKLKELVEVDKLKNQCLFVYYAQYTGNKASIESEINLAAIKDYKDYLMILQDPEHRPIVRSIKYLLTLPQKDLKVCLDALPAKKIKQLYHGALGEGYYKIASYQQNFQLLLEEYKSVNDQ